MLVHVKGVVLHTSIVSKSKILVYNDNHGSKYGIKCKKKKNIKRNLHNGCFIEQ